ncbi:hypothetical protein [Subtercola sp. YIM 133946]|uniref:hypothetical protein n=1 Tax=Subtercola sp. YIM 133946 TaxID=3118909 RepID=UPI002F94E8D9
MKRRTPMALVVALALALTACSGSPEPSSPLSSEDAAALKTLGQVAGPTSNVDPAEITGTECWLPSDHLVVDETVSATTWRVLCRTHYVDSTGDRYQDATCVGDFDAQPMLDHCYRWAYYTGTPRFEDAPAVAAG